MFCSSTFVVSSILLEIHFWCSTSALFSLSFHSNCLFSPPLKYSCSLCYGRFTQPGCNGQLFSDGTYSSSPAARYLRLFYDSFCALLTLSVSDFNRAVLISFPVVVKHFTDNGMKCSCFSPQDRFSEVFLQVCGLDTRLEGRMTSLLSLMQLVSAYSSMGFIHSEPEEERRLLSLGTWTSCQSLTHTGHLMLHWSSLWRSLPRLPSALIQTYREIHN